VRTFFGQAGGGFRCRGSHFWSKKLRNFLNLWCVHTDKGSWTSANILRTMGEGVHFSRFCADVF